MEQTQRPVNDRTPVRVMDKKEGKRANMVLGLIYDVENQRFHKVYKGLTTGRIRIEGASDEADREESMSVSAA